LTHLLSVRREVGEFRRRYKWMAAFVVLAFAVLLGRAVQMQLIEYRKFNSIAYENITRTIPLPASRGLIRDKNGEILATNIPSFNVFITPHLLDPIDDTARLAELMGLSSEQLSALRQRLSAIPAHRRNHRIEMFSDITREQLASLENHSEEFRGLDVVAVPRRLYPFGILAAHGLGYLNEVNADDLKQLGKRGYGVGDRIGRSGIERAFERLLHGQNGYRKVLVDARGNIREGRGRGERTTEERAPAPGLDLELTLDMSMMKLIDRAFRNQSSGAVVAVEVNTGRVLALFSKPSYDLNQMSGHLSSAALRQLADNMFHPLIDKTLYATYYPGSTFKPISALTALQDHIVNPSSKVECTGQYTLGNRQFRCTHVHGEVDMRAALTRSCNVYFYRLSEQLNIDRMAQHAHELGLGERTGIGINTESRGFIPTKKWYTDQGQRFRLGYTLNASIGQGNTRVTLIQIAMAYAAFANGGNLYVPQLVERITHPSGAVMQTFGAKLRRKTSFTQEELSVIREGLYGVVNREDGTAYDVRVPDGVSIVGKTGTAQVAHYKPKVGEDRRRADYYNRDHAWFAGFAPADNPQVAIVVLVEHGGGGGKYAAPIAVEVLEGYFNKPLPN